MSTLTETKHQYAVRFGRSRNVVAVATIRDASEAWEKLRDEQCLGGSESPKVTVVSLATGKTVATISYNGRAWDMAGNEIALPRVTKGQRVYIKPEFQDEGDQDFTWITTEDEDGGRVSISPVDIGLPIPPVTRVSLEMLEGF